jgi:hypothetical protein
MRTFLIMLSLLAVTGCEQAFRYPCQDPANWNAPECQRPICEVNRDCPDLIFKDNPNIELPKILDVAPSRSAPVPTLKGECK